MASSGSFICSSCFALFLSLLLKIVYDLSLQCRHSILDRFLHCTKFKIHSLSKIHSAVKMLSIESLKSFSSLKKIVLRATTSARSCTHAQRCKTCSSLKPEDVLKEAALTWFDLHLKALFSTAFKIFIRSPHGPPYVKIGLTGRCYKR